MSVGKLEVVAVDFYSGREFILYFSDDTYVALSAESLATLFPERLAIPLPDRRDVHEGLVRLEDGE